MPVEVEVAATEAGVTKAAAAGATAAAAGTTAAAAVTTEAAATAATGKSAVYWVVEGGNKSSYILRGTAEQKKLSRNRSSRPAFERCSAFRAMVYVLTFEPFGHFSSPGV